MKTAFPILLLALEPGCSTPLGVAGRCAQSVLVHELEPEHITKAVVLDTEVEEFGVRSVYARQRHWERLWRRLDRPAPKVDFWREFVVVRRKDAENLNRYNFHLYAVPAGVVSAAGMQTRVSWFEGDSTRLDFFRVPRRGGLCLLDETGLHPL